jgi:hypothetical protein
LEVMTGASQIAVSKPFYLGFVSNPLFSFQTN